MRSIRVGSLAIVLLVLTVGFWCAQAQVAANGAGSIEGTVGDPQGAVISGAEVTATNELTGQQVSTTTDSTGSYRFSPPPGNYRVRFAMRGFKSETRTSVPVRSSKDTRVDIRLAVGSGSGVEVMAAPPVSEDSKNQVSVVMNGGSHAFEDPQTPASGAIAGTVIDPQGAPIAGARVTLTEYATGARYETATDCAGMYRIDKLTASTYSVQFAKKAFRTDTVGSVRVEPSRATELNHKLQVGTGDSGPVIEGSTIPVETGSSDSAVAIQGRVTDPKGEPVPARIAAYGYLTDKYYSTTTDSDGVYRMTGLPAGNYCFASVANPWGPSSVEIVTVSPKQVVTRDFQSPALPERAEECTASCVIETTVAKPANPGIALHVYAERNVVFAAAPLWITVTLTNTTRHSIVIRSHGEPHHDFEYNLYAYQYAWGRCGCPGRLVTNPAGSAELLRQESPSSEVRIPPGGTLTDRVDISRLMDWDRLIAFGPTFKVWVSRLDTSKEKHGKERKGLPVVRSNLIEMALITP